MSPTGYRECRTSSNIISKAGKCVGKFPDETKHKEASIDSCQLRLLGLSDYVPPGFLSIVEIIKVAGTSSWCLGYLNNCMDIKKKKKEI